MPGEGSAVRLNWQGGNRYYQLQRRNNLGSGDWEIISPPTTTTNVLISPRTPPAAFYRVQHLGD